MPLSSTFWEQDSKWLTCRLISLWSCVQAWSIEQWPRTQVKIIATDCPTFIPPQMILVILVHLSVVHLGMDMLLNSGQWDLRRLFWRASENGSWKLRRRHNVFCVLLCLFFSLGTKAAILVLAWGWGQHKKDRAGRKFLSLWWYLWVSEST